MPLLLSERQARRARVVGPTFKEAAMATPAISVRSASSAEHRAVVRVITLAFAADPVVRWTLPDPDVYRSVMPEVAMRFGGNGFAHGSAHIVEGRAGAAMWLPPGVEPDGEGMLELMQKHVPPHILPDALEVFEQMGRHHPPEPHWYLPLIGVDPARQNCGIGSALLRHALAVCDRDGVPAYLESSNPRNIPLYQRHGFEIIGTIQVGSSPPIVPMLRRPR